MRLRFGSPITPSTIADPQRGAEVGGSRCVAGEGENMLDAYTGNGRIEKEEGKG